MRIIALCLSLISWCVCLAQEPSHYFFGDDELTTVNIYDIIQDHDRNYWFATDEGLIKYDGYEYEHIRTTDMKSQSVFNLRMNSKGHIFCNNLNNQVFRIQNSKMELYYTIPEKDRHHNTFLEIDGDDQVIIQAQGLTIIEESGETRNIKHQLLDRNSRISMHLLSDGTCLSTSFSDLFIVKNDESQKCVIRTDIETNDRLALSAWLSNENGIYAIDQTSASLFKLDTLRNHFQFIRTIDESLKGSAIRIYQSKGCYWVVGNKNGAYVFDLNWKPLYNGELILRNQFISDVYTDAENSTVLGTFGDGLMIIPDMDAVNVAIPTGELKQLCAKGDTIIFMGNSNGEVYQYNLITQNISLLYRSDKQKPIEYMAYWHKHDILFFTSTTGYMQYDFKDSVSPLTEHKNALKDMAFHDEYALAALNKGVQRLLVVGDSIVAERFHVLQGRAYGVSVNKEHNVSYALMSSGLQALSKNGEELLLYNEEPIFASAAISRHEFDYISTHHDGILVLKDRKVVDQIDMETPALKLKLFDDNIYALSGNDIHKYDGNAFITIESIATENKSQIQDFIVLNDRYYLAINNVLISYSANFQNTDSEVEIRGVRTLVNGVDNTNQSLNHDQNEIGFIINAPTLRYQKHAQYLYRLEGYESSWQTATYDDNSIVYKKLPPGDYTMHIKTINGQVEGSEWIYKFTIKTPYYQTTWFYLLIVFTLIIVISSIYFFRIKQLQKKSAVLIEQQKMQTDLLEMELKALRSQMNPHFIFNSLNSIQSLVLKEDIDNSYDYLVLFAKLVRATLNYSDLSFIPINEEVDFLETYLSLEKLRFREEFSFSIDYTGEDYVDVPPLVIQPFIENAIVHGLMHKTGDKRVEIKIQLKEQLLVSIVDNGVGRKKSKEINVRRNAEHKSFAMKAINQRLNLLNKHLDTEEGAYEITDLYDDNQAIGTKVVLTLPVKFRF